MNSYYFIIFTVFILLHIPHQVLGPIVLAILTLLTLYLMRSTDPAETTVPYPDGPGAAAIMPGHGDEHNYQHETFMSPVRRKAIGVPTLPTDTSVTRRAVPKSVGQHPFPSELEATPDDVEVPPDLVNIIIESLRPKRPDRPAPAAPVAAESEAEPPTASLYKNTSSSTADIQNASGRSMSVSSAAHSSHSDHSNGNAQSSSNPKSRSWLTASLQHVKSSIKPKDEARKHEVETNGECASCFDELPIKKLISLKCTHNYCSTCFSQLITTALATEAVFPPKCCLTRIPLKTIWKSLSHEQREQYRLKAAEYAVPAGDRWYCPSPACAKWIHVSRLNGPVTASFQRRCPHCSTKICAICRGGAHPHGQECPQDFGLDATLDIAEQEGWRRCYKCGALVELSAGCRHMTCTCKAQFCYTCGKGPWRSCHCTETDEANRKANVLAAKMTRDSAAAREEREIAEAVAAVEEVERREAAELARIEAWRIRREEEVARERAAEEERLERIRAAEEERKRREEQERLERHQREVESSVNARYAALGIILGHLSQYQRALLDDRHEQESADLAMEAQSAWLRFHGESARLIKLLETNITRRTERVQSTQSAASSEMDTRHEEQEDETFLSCQLHLRGKSNRESRTESMMSRLREEQQIERSDLRKRHVKETKKYQSTCLVEKKALEMGLGVRRDVEIAGEAKTQQEVADRMSAERQWMEEITKMRLGMLEEWKVVSIARGEVVEEMERQLVEKWERREEDGQWMQQAGYNEEERCEIDGQEIGKDRGVGEEQWVTVEDHREPQWVVKAKAGEMGPVISVGLF